MDSYFIATGWIGEGFALADDDDVVEDGEIGRGRDLYIPFASFFLFKRSERERER